MAEPQVPEVRTPAAPKQHEKYPWPEHPTLVGTRMKRLDGPAKVDESLVVATGGVQQIREMVLDGRLEVPVTDPPADVDGLQTTLYGCVDIA